MSSFLPKPYDKGSAVETMKKFNAMSYSVINKGSFQEAVNILYGPEFQITEDLQRRMQFSCRICNREMNSENAMKEHNNSGGHQKNLDKRNRDMGVTNFRARASNYAEDSIQYKLLTSYVEPVGLQMIEEYINRKGNIYYKCILCGAHGRLDTMYQHITQKKHTERYIKSGIVLQNGILNPNEREALRKKLVKDEGINVDAIKTIKGNDYYPYKWEKEGSTSKLITTRIKRECKEYDGARIKNEELGAKVKSEYGAKRKERRSSSDSPTPGPSRGRSRSFSPPGYHDKSPSDRSRRRYTRSPPGRNYGSPYSSDRYYGPPPPPERDNRSPPGKYYNRSPLPQRKRHSSSSSTESEMSRRMTPQFKKENLIAPAEIKTERSSSPPGLPSSSLPAIRVRDFGELSMYRNRSPSPNRKEKAVKVKEEPKSFIKDEPPSPTSDFSLPLQMPVKVPKIKKETSDATVQTKVFLDMEMDHLNEYVKKCGDNPSSLRTPEDVKKVIDIMNSYAQVFRGIILTVLQDGTPKSSERIQLLRGQQEKIEKVIGYITKWYLPTYEREILNSNDWY